MLKFIETVDNFFSVHGIQLKQRVRTELDYYNGVENIVDIK